MTCVEVVMWHYSVAVWPRWNDIFRIPRQLEDSVGSQLKGISPSPTKTIGLHGVACQAQPWRMKQVNIFGGTFSRVALMHYLTRMKYALVSLQNGTWTRTSHSIHLSLVDYSVLSVGVMTLGLILIVEVARHKLDHMVHHFTFYKHVVEGVYSECRFLHACDTLNDGARSIHTSNETFLDTSGNSWNCRVLLVSHGILL